MDAKCLLLLSAIFYCNGAVPLSRTHVEFIRDLIKKFIISEGIYKNKNRK